MLHVAGGNLQALVIGGTGPTGHYIVNGLIASVLGLIAFEFAVSVGEAESMREVSQALGIPRAWMYAYLSLTSGLAAVAALTAGLPVAHSTESDL